MPEYLLASFSVKSCEYPALPGSATTGSLVMGSIGALRLRFLMEFTPHTSQRPVFRKHSRTRDMSGGKRAG
jgi:hypothetical protein